MAAAAAQRAHRGGGGRGAADRVDRDVGAAARELADALRHVALARVERVLGAELGRARERAGRHVDRHDAGAERAGEHHHRQPDAAAAVDGEPVAGAHAAALADGGERGHEAAAERRGRLEAEPVGERHAVEVGDGHEHALGERAPAREARLVVALADLRVAEPARLAGAAAAAERRGHAVARPDPAHLGPDRRDDAGELVAGHVGEADRGVVAHPAVPVAAAQPGRADLDERAVRRQLGLGDLLEPSGSRKACMTAARTASGAAAGGGPACRRRRRSSCPSWSRSAGRRGRRRRRRPPPA